MHPPEHQFRNDSFAGFTGVNISYSLLRQDFQFVVQQTELIPSRSIIPDGLFLVVCADNICELVQLFLTSTDLRCITRVMVHFTISSRRLIKKCRFHLYNIQTTAI